MEKKFDHTRLAALRKELGLSGEALAKHANLTQGFISALERGEKSPSIETAGALANALGTSIAYLVGETNDPRITFTTTLLDEGIKQKETPRISQATLDLEAMVKDLVYEYPDLAIGFRDTRENWAILPEEDKQSIADGLMSLFHPNPNRPSRLRDKGRKGQV